jgi:hypothetical protein
MSQPSVEAAAGTAPCLNCGEPLPRRFCPACGQSTAEVRVSLRRLVADAVDDHFSLNAALPRTLYLLLLKPGQLTSDVLAGRRARYIPPLRLYLVCSFLYFLVFGLGGRSVQVGGAFHFDDDGVVVAQPATEASGARADREAGTGIGDGRDSAMPGGDGGSTGDVMGEIPFLGRQGSERFAERLRQLQQMPEGEQASEIGRQFTARLPIAVFLLVPFAAALLKVAYIRSRRYYAEHFVFALHLHAFVFLLLAARALATTPWLSRILMLWLLVYLVQSLRRVYGESAGRTLLKLTGVGLGYALMLGFSLAALAVLSVLAVAV